VHFQCHVPLSGSVKRARARLLGSDWLSLLPVAVEATDDRAWLRWTRPVPLAIHVQLVPHDQGVRLQLLEGPLTRLTVTLTAFSKQLAVDVQVGFPVPVPGALLRSLEHELVPAWAAAVARSVAD
jgi:hypothetical protein